MIFKILNVGDKEYRLKFGAKALMSIEQNAWEYPLRFEHVRRVLPEELLAYLSSTEVVIYLLSKALDWKESGAKPADASEIFDAYFDGEELDTGEKLDKLHTTISEALLASRGIDAKNWMEKMKMEAEKQTAIQEQKKAEELKIIYKAKMLAEAEIKAEAGIGTKQLESV